MAAPRPRGPGWAAACCTAAFFAGLATVAGESTYAGDRDVRFLNCAVPCEFECAHRAVPVSQLLRQKHVRRLWKDPRPGQPVDLYRQGKEAYTQALLIALEQEEAHGRRRPARSAARELGAQHVSTPTEQLAPPLRWLRWTCEEDCRYGCMLENSRARREAGEQQVHYNGKWPFTRVAGVQELFSSAFSLLNGLPYMRFLASRPAAAPRTLAARLWTFHALVHVNTWCQSAVFHARESPVTEALDYHGATLGLSVTFAIALFTNLPQTWRPWLMVEIHGTSNSLSHEQSTRRMVLLALVPVLAFWVAHVLYLSFVNFDYGYNMQVAVGLGICSTLLWVAWAVRHWRTRPFAWKVLFAAAGPYLVLPLELLDFPPLFGLLDAHALWHLGTVPMSAAWCSYSRDYLRHEAVGLGKDV